MIAPRQALIAPRQALIDRCAAGWAIIVAAAYAAAVVSGTPVPRTIASRQLIVLAGAVLGVLAVAALDRRSLRAVAAAALAIGAAATAASGRLGAAAAAAATLAVCLFVGDGLARAAGGGAWRGAARIAVSTGLGIPALAGLVFLLAAFHALTPAGIAAGSAALLALTTLARSRSADPSGEPAPLEPAAPEEPLLRALTGAAVLLAGLSALLPEVEFDALNYHLAAPRDWLAARTIPDLPYWHAYLAHAAEAVFAFPLAFGGAPAARLVAFGVSLAVVAAGYAIGLELFGRRAAWWTAASTAAIPVSGRLGVTAGSDGALALLIAASLLVFFRLRREPAAGTAAVFGILAGGAIATKISGAFTEGVLALVLAADVMRRRASPRVLAAAAAGAIVAAAPWFWTTFRLTGSPVFPFLNAWFRSPLIRAENSVMNAPIYGVGKSFGALVKLPFLAVFQTHRFGEAIADGDLGIVLLIAPIAAIAALRRRLDRRHAIAAAVAAAHLVALAFVFQYARYVSAVLPILAALAAAGLLALSGRPRTIALAAAGSALVLTAVLFARRLPLRTEPARAFLTGRSGEAAYLDRALGAFSCVEAINREATPSERVAATGAAGRRFYIVPPVDGLGESYALHRDIRNRKGEALRAALWDRGDRLLWIGPRGPRKFGGTFVDPDFVATFADPVCEDRGTRVFRLRPPGSAPPNR